MHPPWRWSGSSGTGFDSQSVVYGNPELLLASEVAFGCLDGDVAEQELDLIQFTAGEMAETGAGAPQVVRSERPEPAATTSSAVSSNARLDRPRAECCHRALTR